MANALRYALAIFFVLGVGCGLYVGGYKMIMLGEGLFYRKSCYLCALRINF